MQYFQTQCCQYFSTSEPSDGCFSHGLHGKIICIAFRMVCNAHPALLSVRHSFVLVGARVPFKFSGLLLQCVTNKTALSRHHKNASVSLASMLSMLEPFI